MTESTYLFVDGIPGEATRKGHEGEIEVLGWRWSARSSASSTGGGSARGKAKAGKLHVLHDYDKASPGLVKALAQGRHIAQVRLTRRRSGEGQKDFFTLTMTDVQVTRVEPSGDDEGAIEEVSFHAGKISVSYSPQDAKGGTGAPVTMGWDTRTGQVT